MELLINDIVLEDNIAEPTGGVAYEGETLGDFLAEVEGEKTFHEINDLLIKCGINPITLGQIKVVGRKGE